MKTLIQLIAIGAIGASAAALSSNTVRAQKTSPEQYVEWSNSYAAALYDLARERFVSHETKNETWVMSVHNRIGDQPVRKFTDGKYVVVSIPVYEFNRDGVALYVGHYNDLTIRKADLLALAGNYPDALKIYQLVQRFNNCSQDGNSGVKARIDCIEHILKSENLEDNLQRIRSLSENLGSSQLEQIETLTPIFHTNLLDLVIEPKK